MFLIGKKICGVLIFVAMVGTIIVGFAKYASYCGLIFVDRGIPQNLYTSKISTHMVTLGYYRRIRFL